MEGEIKQKTPLTIKESGVSGEKIIFDIVIKQKLAHVIVMKDQVLYHVNLDGEDLGSFSRENGKITHYEQPKGANTDVEDYFKAIEAKLEELGKF